MPKRVTLCRLGSPLKRSGHGNGQWPAIRRTVETTSSRVSSARSIRQLDRRWVCLHQSGHRASVDVFGNLQMPTGTLSLARCSGEWTWLFVDSRVADLRSLGYFCPLCIDQVVEIQCSRDFKNRLATVIYAERR